MDIYFSALDELIQIIYQGSAKFVLMSRVDYNSWTVHLGLSGPEGRWWRGRWTDESVKSITVGFFAHLRVCGITEWCTGLQAE
jgi:hypothetical protein